MFKSKNFGNLVFFISLLGFLSNLYAFERKPFSNLLSPNGTTIVDIGKKDNIEPVNVTKILKEVPASVRIFTDNYILAKRNINRYSCLADEYGYQACSKGLQECTHSVNYLAGSSQEYHIHKEKPKERVTATAADRSGDSFYANWLINPNHGSISGSKISVIADETYNPHDTFPSAAELYKQGWRTPDGKFAMKIFNYGSGCGGMSIKPLPDHFKIIANGGSKVEIKEYKDPCDQLISSKDGQYATVLLIWDKIPTEPIKFECDDYCLAGNPNSPVGFWKWGCNKPWIFKDDKCYLDYYYYLYSCPIDERTGKELPILVSTGSDCGGFCGGYGCKCNSETPPANNCAENLYSCPYGSDIPCASVTTDYDPKDATNTELGYEYALGESIAHENNLTKEPICPKGGAFDANKSICVASTDSENCPTGSNLLEHKCVVPYSCPGIMIGTKCEIKPTIECNDANAKYYTSYKGCAISKQCSKGSLNPISGKCEFDPEPPTGWKYDRELNQFVKEPLITTDPICADSALEWDHHGRCTGTPNFNEWTKLAYDPHDSAAVWSNTSTTLTEEGNSNQPVFFLSPVSISSGKFSGTIDFGTGTTTDLVGLLFGYQNKNNYYVASWRGDNDAGFQPYDLALAEARGTGNKLNYISHIDGSYGWHESTTYTMSVIFRDDKAEVYINDNLKLSVDNLDITKMSTGKIGFWAWSTMNVTFSNFTIDTKPTCPSGYLYMEGYDICVYNEGSDVTIDVPNNRYLRSVYCSLGVLNPKTGKCETSSSCNGAYPYEDSTQNKCYGHNNYRAICPDTTSWMLVSSSDFPGYSYACQSTDGCNNGYHKEIIDGHTYCAQNPQKSCPAGYILDKETGECYADPICTDGYVYDKNESKCVIHYTWYEYTCPSDFEGPVVNKGKDCEGHCGYDGCECNPKTPPANNCRKNVGAPDNYDLFEKRNMIVHQILNDGSFNGKEFGIVKRFACNTNPNETCSFDVTKVWGDGNKLCFSNNAGNQACYTVYGCEFWGEINNKDLSIGNRIYNKSDEINNLRIFDDGYGIETLIPFTPSAPGVCDNIRRSYIFQSDSNHGYYYCNSKIKSDPFTFDDIKKEAQDDNKDWCFSEGLDLRVMVFKLSDGKWYVTPFHSSYGCGYDSEYYSTLPSDSITDIEYVPGHEGQKNYVLRFKLTLPTGLKLEAVSDLESATKEVLGVNACNGDNIFDQDYYVWLAGDTTNKKHIIRHAIGVASAGSINLSDLSDGLFTYNDKLNICYYHNRGVYSTCRMNGGVGNFDREEGISSIEAGGVTYNYAIIDANGSIDWDVNATQAGVDNISEGFNIGLMAIKLSDGNWYVAKDFKDKNGNSVDRRLPDFVKRLDNHFYQISNKITLPDGNVTIANLDCNYKGIQLDPKLCGLKVKITLPKGHMKIEEIRDIESLLNFKEKPYGATEDTQSIYWYKNNEYNLTLKFPLANNYVKLYKGSKKRMDAIKVPDLATAASKINLFGGSDLTDNDFNYLQTIEDIESQSAKKGRKIPLLKDRLYFWDSFMDGLLGSIQFVREVKEEDRLEGFVPEDIIPYYMLENGFMSLSDPSKDTLKTIFVNNSLSADSPKCSSIAANIGGNVINYFANQSVKDLMSFTYPAETAYNLYEALGVQDIGHPCIIEKDGLHAIEDVLAAQRKLVYRGTKKMMCSPYKCVDFECKLAECPDGYNGDTIPNSYKEPGKCIFNTCDVFDPNGFVDICGKLGPCNTAKPGVVKEGNTCKELYCPKGMLDPIKGTCTISECPDGYHEDSSGKCVK